MKKIIDCFTNLVKVTALIHVPILVIKAVKDGDSKSLNYFKILNLDSFFPRIINGWLSDFFSILLMLTIFGFFLFLSFQKEDEK